jgi:hypothetical protein
MEQLMILIAGPYRSGTNDDPALLAENVRQMNEVALEVYRKGHLPIVGEWFALPLIATAGSRQVGDAIFQAIFHPIAMDILNRCQAVLRVGGKSAGADLMIQLATEQGKRVFYRVEDILPTAQKNERPA